ncbi:hypothetical protein MTR_1g057390 [Medicago truncatula]|uniref:Uncharacterized protein n=1 Tax=Medicago truncatula TaxID=3880 RepID=A0A072VKH9_MEDTR|nr:hypothetical protein MTR_1g057390 [Medicago truncatula]
MPTVAATDRDTTLMNAVATVLPEKSNEDVFSVVEEWNDIQERLKKVPYQMKLQIKEVLRQLTFLEATMLSPPPRKVPTKGAKKKEKR